MSGRDELYLYDKRVIEFNIRKGFVTKKDYEKFLKELPDNESNAEYIELREDAPAHTAGLTFFAAEG